MKSYAKWKERSILVTSLLLDTLNPRLPIADKSLSQAELIEELVVHDDVYSLAKSIAEKGYYPGESLIGIQENGKKCILEGNRRLAALKLLISPAAAPERYQKRPGSDQGNRCRGCRYITIPVDERGKPINKVCSSIERNRYDY